MAGQLTERVPEIGEPSPNGRIVDAGKVSEDGITNVADGYSPESAADSDAALIGGNQADAKQPDRQYYERPSSPPENRRAPKTEDQTSAPAPKSASAEDLTPDTATVTMAAVRKEAIRDETSEEVRIASRAAPEAQEQPETGMVANKLAVPDQLSVTASPQMATLPAESPPDRLAADRPQYLKSLLLQPAPILAAKSLNPSIAKVAPDGRVFLDTEELRKLGVKTTYRGRPVTFEVSDRHSTNPHAQEVALKNGKFLRVTPHPSVTPADQARPVPPQLPPSQFGRVPGTWDRRLTLRSAVSRPNMGRLKARVNEMYQDRPRMLPIENIDIHPDSIKANPDQTVTFTASMRFTDKKIR